MEGMECNRGFEEAGLYIRDMEYDALCQHKGLSKLWKTELEQQNRDYSIAMKASLIKTNGYMIS